MSAITAGKSPEIKTVIESSVHTDVQILSQAGGCYVNSKTFDAVDRRSER
jgi:hypothetical protein